MLSSLFYILNKYQYQNYLLLGVFHDRERLDFTLKFAIFWSSNNDFLSDELIFLTKI